MILISKNSSICSHTNRIGVSATRLLHLLRVVAWLIAACWFIFFCSLFPTQNVLAQELNLEELFESESDYEDQSELIEYLQSLMQHPMDLNQVSIKEIQTIPWITPNQAQGIVSFRREHGNFTHTSQLLQVPEMDKDTYKIIRHFLIVYEPKIPVHGYLNARQRLSTRVVGSHGYKKGVYAGTKHKNYNRTIFGISEFASAGILLEKDAGERRLDDLTLGFLKIHIGSLHTDILLGNFKFEVGQGLAFWGPYGFSKSSNAVAPIKKRSRGLREYLSVDENAGLQGIAVNTKVRWLQLTGLYSRTHLDATISDDGEITSLYTSGYHRTDSEQEKRDKAREDLYGCRASIDVSNNARVSATFQSSRYEPGFEIYPTREWSSTLRGNHNRIVSTDFDLFVGRANIFGEFATSKSGGRALYTGMIVDFGSADFALSVRRYDRDFQNLHGNAFGERNGIGQNENGYYLGLSGRILPSTRFSFYFDQFKHPYPTSTTQTPVQGWDSVGLIEQKLAQKQSLSLKIRIKNKEHALIIQDKYGRDQRKIDLQRRITTRLQLNCTMVPRLRLRSRIEKAWVQWDDIGDMINTPPSSQGVILFQDARLDVSQQISMNVRLTFFDTESYDARLYQHEAGLPGMWTSRMLYGRGTRWYTVVCLKIARWMTTYFKYSYTSYDDRDCVGTGWEKIDSTKDRRLDVQIDWNLK